MSVSDVPDAWTATARRALEAMRWLLSLRTSVSSWWAMRLRSVSTIDTGRTRRSSFEALLGVISVLRPPGINSASTAWSREAAWVLRLESWVCRLANIRKTVT